MHTISDKFRVWRMMRIERRDMDRYLCQRLRMSIVSIFPVLTLMPILLNQSMWARLDRSILVLMLHYYILPMKRPGLSIPFGSKRDLIRRITSIAELGPHTSSC